MNNNKTTAEALEGTFAKTQFLSVGVPFTDGKEALRPSYKGKQFAVTGPKEGKTTDVYFERKHLWVADGAPYADRWKYSELQKEKKKGFLTSDFSKRDEFSNTIRTGQYREQLKVRAVAARQGQPSDPDRPDEQPQQERPCPAQGRCQYCALISSRHQPSSCCVSLPTIGEPCRCWCAQQETAHAKKALEMMGTASCSALAQEMATTAAGASAGAHKPVSNAGRQPQAGRPAWGLRA
jgi:hypothetical protein